MWTRSAFYEKEAEVFVQSEAFASELLARFEMEKDAYCTRIETPGGCERFLPRGCAICEGFGPFYEA